jgi:hypothetical protein
MLAGRGDNGNYSRKLNGYRCSHRNKWLLISCGVLTMQELSLLEFYADIFDFDKNHPNCGLFEVDFHAIAQIFNKSNNTIRNWHNRLLNLGFIKSTNKRKAYRLVIHERYTSPGFWEGKAAKYAKQEKDQPIEIILQNFGINLQKIGGEDQPVVKNNSKTARKIKSIAIVSSKDESRFYPKRIVIEQKARSEKEYQKIWKENDWKHTTPEDMRWIDENVKETKTVENEEMEKAIVSVFFNKDWQKYQQALIKTYRERR